ncbi:Aste57867_24926 [Aphanomyces stellatus]|uniref:Aste57867_24926 protein n=1 Tax=Aphanomyces stellatus TaxID=120398 RepID=A0A485LSC3_9STRA|nr:hypothetical protein As57867_024848 [Aphanomyces stellatus]VFU01558.1 Aste57867_24926 [Aphanomyces stellatus]
MRTTFFLALVATSATSQAPQKVSVVGDATYAISGPLCSGSGVVPAGNKCPIKGDVAVEACLKYLPSFTNDKCVAPVDAVCQKIPSGAWGCVWAKADSTSVPSVTTASVPRPRFTTGTPPATASPTPPTSDIPRPRYTTRAPNATNGTNTTNSFWAFLGF